MTKLALLVWNLYLLEQSFKMSETENILELEQKNLPDTAIVAEEALLLRRKVWVLSQGTDTGLLRLCRPIQTALQMSLHSKCKYGELRKHTAMTLSNCTYPEEGCLYWVPVPVGNTEQRLISDAVVSVNQTFGDNTVACKRLASKWVEESLRTSKENSSVWKRSNNH